MKITKNQRFIPAGLLAAGSLTLLTASVQAASFTYTNTDLLLAFRESGQPDLVLDIGLPSIYDAVPPGTTIPVANVSGQLPNLLNNNYPSLDGLSWSLTGAWRTALTNYPLQTVWASAARSDLNTQTIPWVRQTQSSQGGPASQIAAIGNNAAAYSSAHPGNAKNTATAVVIPNSDPNAYTPLIEDPFNKNDGNLGGIFQGNVENTTPFDFDSDEPLSISDLYELQPVPAHTSGPGKWVGYFSFTPDGNVTFTAASVAPPIPVATSITRRGNVTTVSFITAPNFTYGLLVTNAAGLTAPRSTWPAASTTISGNGSVLSLQDTNSSDASFYIITAH